MGRESPQIEDISIRSYRQGGYILPVIQPTCDDSSVVFPTSYFHSMVVFQPEFTLNIISKIALSKSEDGSFFWGERWVRF